MELQISALKLILVKSFNLLRIGISILRIPTNPWDFFLCVCMCVSNLHQNFKDSYKGEGIVTMVIISSARTFERIFCQIEVG